MISEKCKWGAWGSKKEAASLCGVFRTTRCFTTSRVTDRVKLCLLVCGETLVFFIGFAWLKLLLALVCACKSV